jgi:hypothetical protein
MHVKRLNRPLFDLSLEHPARRFLESFIACHKHCVGAELRGVDQLWFSQAESRQMFFSGFVYAYLSFDIVLDGWLNNAPELTESERCYLDGIGQLEILVHECLDEATKDRNAEIIEMCHEVSKMLVNWRDCIEHRRSQLKSNRRTNQD